MTPARVRQQLVYLGEPSGNTGTGTVTFFVKQES